MRPVDADEAKRIAREYLTDPYHVISAVAVLDKTPTLTPPNEPLTWNEFEAMIDKPVYIIELERPKRSYWALVHQVSDAGVMLTSAIDLHDYGSRDLYGQSWLAYRRPPEGEACGLENFAPSAALP